MGYLLYDATDAEKERVHAKSADKLRKQLEKLRNGSSTQLSMSDQIIPFELFQEVCEEIKYNQNLIDLSITRIKISSKSAEAYEIFCEAIKHSISITTFLFDESYLGQKKYYYEFLVSLPEEIPVQEYQYLAQAIKENTSIKKLTINVSEGFDIIMQDAALNQSITHLDCSESYMKEGTNIDKVLAVIKSNKNLQFLKLHCFRPEDPALLSKICHEIRMNNKTLKLSVPGSIGNGRVTYKEIDPLKKIRRKISFKPVDEAKALTLKIQNNEKKNIKLIHRRFTLEAIKNVMSALSQSIYVEKLTTANRAIFYDGNDLQEKELLAGMLQNNRSIKYFIFNHYSCYHDLMEDQKLADALQNNNYIKKIKINFYNHGYADNVSYILQGLAYNKTIQELHIRDSCSYISNENQIAYIEDLKYILKHNKNIKKISCKIGKLEKDVEENILNDIDKIIQDNGVIEELRISNHYYTRPKNLAPHTIELPVEAIVPPSSKHAAPVIAQPSIDNTYNQQETIKDHCKKIYNKAKKTYFGFISQDPLFFIKSNSHTVEKKVAFSILTSASIAAIFASAAKHFQKTSGSKYFIGGAIGSLLIGSIMSYDAINRDKFHSSFTEKAESIKNNIQTR